MLSEAERAEIEALRNAPAVELARQAKRKKVDPAKQLLYTLRYLKKQGEKLIAEEMKKW